MSICLDQPLQAKDNVVTVKEQLQVNRHTQNGTMNMLTQVTPLAVGIRWLLFGLVENQMYAPFNEFKWSGTDEFCSGSHLCGELLSLSSPARFMRSSLSKAGP